MTKSVWCARVRVGHLIAARALQGLGGVLLIPGSLALISASFPADVRGRAIGLWSGFSALTAAAGPVLGGWLIDTLSWRWIFLANISVVFVILAIAATQLPESRDPRAHRLDWPGALQITASLTGITYGLLESPTRGFSHPAVLAALLLVPASSPPSSSCRRGRRCRWCRSTCSDLQPSRARTS